MAMQDPKELFVKLLSDVRQNEEKTTSVLQELSDVVEDPDIKEAIESRIFLKNQTLSTLDQCFKLIGEKPQKSSGRIQEVFVEDFRRELGEIQGPLARTLFIAAKANHLMHFRIAEYVALVAMADITGHYAVGSLLESCLADKLAFVERNRRAIRRLVENEMRVGVA
jgi:ferritin-like metal-binding protein YciE